jgi:hypothetical protein
MNRLLTLIFALLTSYAGAGDDPTVTEGLKRLDDVQKEAETWAAKQQSIARQRENDCLKAFGHKGFCACLNKELHWVLGFDGYIRIVTATPDQLSSVPTDERAVVDSAVRARELCVRRTVTPK